MNLEFQKEASVSPKRVSEISEEDMKLINSFALRDLTEDEVAVYHLDLCNDRIDSQNSVFPREELKAISGMVAGKPLLIAHDRRSLPLGTFFKAGLTEDHSDLTMAVRASVYMLRIPENEALLANLDGGVYRSTSIGFLVSNPTCSICDKDIRSCPHVPGHEYEGKRCVVELREVVDVLEGSIVFLGAQRTTFLRPELEKAIKEARIAEPKGLHSESEYREMFEEVGKKNEKDIHLLAVEALEWRMKELNEIIRLGRAVEDEDFDEIIWRRMLSNSSMETLLQARSHFQGLFDTRYPPVPASRPLFNDGSESRKDKARKILEGEI